MNKPTIAQRIDPKSPHYDAKFAEIRKAAYNAWDDHQADMKSDPVYRDYARSKGC